MFERTLRDHKMRVDSEKIKTVSDEMRLGLQKISQMENILCAEWKGN